DDDGGQGARERRAGEQYDIRRAPVPSAGMGTAQQRERESRRRVARRTRTRRAHSAVGGHAGPIIAARSAGATALEPATRTATPVVSARRRGVRLVSSRDSSGEDRDISERR